jgi:malonyl-CoA/methylmalonyl-CoA synthetase
MSLLALYDRSLLGRAASPALDCVDATGTPLALTFGALEERSNRVAHALRARGVQAGDRLAFYLTNRVEIIDLWLACIKTGIIVVPVNVLYREREITHIVSDAAPVAVVTTSAQQSDLPPGVTSWSLEALTAEAAQQSSERITVPCVPNTAAALVYTSGTTGASKGAVLTNGNFAANALALTSSWEFTSDDRYLAVLPLFHVHGLGNGLHVWLLSGCHMRLVERFEHERAAEWFEAYQPTVFFGVPTMFVRLLDVAPERAAAIGARTRLFVSGSAPLPAPVMTIPCAIPRP